MKENPKRNIPANRVRLHILPVRKMMEQAGTLRGSSYGIVGIIICSGPGGHAEPIREVSGASVCQVFFADTQVREHPAAIQPFQAEEIRKYVLDRITESEDYHKPADIFVCCSEGQSRSPAVAAALLTAAGRRDDVIWDNPRYRPNPLVYERMCCAFGITVSAEELTEKALRNELAFRKAKEQGGTAAFKRGDVIAAAQLEPL